MFVIIDGLDRTGKSTVAELYKTQGFEVVHMSAPDKKYTKPGYTGPSYLDDMVEMLISYSGRNVVFDRSVYGELVWPYVYGRAPLLSNEDLSILREIEADNGAEYYMMHDPEVENHWKRCVENNEPLTPSQFRSASDLFNSVAGQYGFIKRVLKDFKELDKTPEPEKEVKPTVEDKTVEVKMQQEKDPSLEFSPEQKRLMQANAINDVLSGRIIKKKGDFYDAVESKIRTFLNGELSSLIGMNVDPQVFTPDEILFLKTLIKQAKKK
jgi:thymidylate kinase